MTAIGVVVGISISHFCSVCQSHPMCAQFHFTIKAFKHDLCVCKCCNKINGPNDVIKSSTHIICSSDIPFLNKHIVCKI